MYSSIEALRTGVSEISTSSADSLSITNKKLLQETVIDALVFTAVFSPDDTVKAMARSTIRMIAESLHIKSASINDYYLAIGKGEIKPTSTVPAINVRAMTYDTARIIFRLKKQYAIGPVIFEIARSEIEYTQQRPDEYATVILAAAIKEDYEGPVFLQGDHFQFSARRFAEDALIETNKIKTLINEAIEADFQNIDIDASTLVNLTKPTLEEQQRDNYRVTVELTKYIRSLEKRGTISIGAEIGHIGGKNSTPEDLEAFMNGFLQENGQNIVGISKISVQTGTSHGGIPLPDGSMAEVKLDFTVIEKTTDIARGMYHLGGVVQHGASTLPNELFDRFPHHKTLEIHLATGFQNIVYDNLPKNLKETMNQWVEQNCQNEWEQVWNKEQFIYKCRKKAIGPFKKALWQLTDEEKQPIRESLEKQLVFIFEQLRIFNTREILQKYV